MTFLEKVQSKLEIWIASGFTLTSVLGFWGLLWIWETHLLCAQHSDFKMQREAVGPNPHCYPKLLICSRKALTKPMCRLIGLVIDAQKRRCVCDVIIARARSCLYRFQIIILGRILWCHWQNWAQSLKKVIILEDRQGGWEFQECFTFRISGWTLGSQRHWISTKAESNQSSGFHLHL